MPRPKAGRRSVGKKAAYKPKGCAHLNKCNRCSAVKKMGWGKFYGLREEMLKMLSDNQEKLQGMAKLILRYKEECPICSEEIKDEAQIKATKCGHLFHKDCLNQWTSQNNSCPSCRTNF